MAVDARYEPMVLLGHSKREMHLFKPAMTSAEIICMHSESMQIDVGKAHQSPIESIAGAGLTTLCGIIE